MTLPKRSFFPPFSLCLMAMMIFGKVRFGKVERYEALDLAEAQLLSTLQLLFDGDDYLRKGTLWKGRALRANLVALDLAEAQLLSTLQPLFDGDDDLRKGTLWKGRALRANLVALDLAEAQLLSTLQLLFDGDDDLRKGTLWQGRALRSARPCRSVASCHPSAFV